MSDTSEYPYITDLNVAWQIDLFGRLRNMTAAANARAQASAADLSGLKLSLQAELATDYFTLRGDDATVQLLEDSVTQFDTAWEQTRRRYDTGVAAATDVDQAETLRQNARSQLAATQLDRARMEHAIAVLLGLSPSAFSLPVAKLAGEPPSIKVALPSALLERRPDVASAERQVAAANAGIGVARAAWFPVFSTAGNATPLGQRNTPVGIVFHTTESNLAPFEEDRDHLGLVHDGVVGEHRGGAVNSG